MNVYEEAGKGIERAVAGWDGTPVTDEMLPAPIRVDRPEPVPYWRIMAGSTLSGPSTPPIHIRKEAVEYGERIVIVQDGKEVVVFLSAVNELISTLRAAKLWKDAP